MIRVYPRTKPTVVTIRPYGKVRVRPCIRPIGARPRPVKKDQSPDPRDRCPRFPPAPARVEMLPRKWPSGLCQENFQSSVKPRIRGLRNGRKILWIPCAAGRRRGLGASRQMRHRQGARQKKPRLGPALKFRSLAKISSTLNCWVARIFLFSKALRTRKKW